MRERIAQTLRRIHQAGSITSAFYPFRVVEAYAVTATRHGGWLPGAHERVHSIAVDIERALLPQPPVLPPQRPAQRQPHRPRRLCPDRRFGARRDGRPFLRLLTAYFGRVATSQLARLPLMRLISDYREAMWGVLRHTIWLEQAAA
jgi:hypothetical protein